MAPNKEDGATAPRVRVHVQYTDLTLCVPANRITAGPVHLKHHHSTGIHSAAPQLSCSAYGWCLPQGEQKQSGKGCSRLGRLACKHSPNNGEFHHTS